ncbi:MAG: substrate-binding domain-containing protein [Chitinophagales bacterium]|nr:substrate-binding domain-containing protein [Chitinophagales bacterium]
MKLKTTLHSLLLVCGALLLLNFYPAPIEKSAVTPAAPELSGKITFSGAYALYPMVVRWGEEFRKLHPKVQFDIQGGGAGKGMTDVLSGTVHLGMVSRDISPEEQAKGAYGVAVCKDAVIITINASNPFLPIIQQKGVTKSKLYELFITGNVTTWGQLLGEKNAKPIKLFTRSDACGASESLAKYLGNYKQEDLNGTGVFADPGVAQAVAKDPLALGYNNINFVYDVKTRKPNPGLVPCPIDVNGNGTLDANEKNYATLDAIDDAIRTGAYPSPPARQLFLVSKGKPNNPLVVAFLQWVLTEGQKYVDESGYVNLPEEQLKKQAAALSPKP